MNLGYACGDCMSENAGALTLTGLCHNTLAVAPSHGLCVNIAIP